MRRNMAETILGAVVLIVAGAFLYFFVTTAQIQTVQGYSISARFANIGGLQTGSDVRISGIAVGTVTGRQIDPEDYDALVTMTIRDGVNLPKDTAAAIGSGGFIGGPHLVLKPGTSKENIAAGGKIVKTVDFKALEEQVGEVIFLATGGNK